MPHDFVNFPELANAQMDFYYMLSPHIQILEDFRAKVVKVHDGDTITVRWHRRNFDFPVRLLGIDAPEMNEGGGKSQKWLEGIVLNEEVDVLIDPRQRVGKWGRILGTIIHRGINLNEEAIREGRAVPFDRRREGEIPDFRQELWKIWH